VFTSIDAQTGRPAVDESKRPGAGQGAGFCPSIGGGRTGRRRRGVRRRSSCTFLPTTTSALSAESGVPKQDTGGFYVGYEVESIFGSVRTAAGAADHLGELQAWDLNTGKRVWQHNFKTILWAPLLVTGGDLYSRWNARSGVQGVRRAHGGSTLELPAPPA